jgi:hypothetical protein
MDELFQNSWRDVVVDRDVIDGDLVIISVVDGKARLAYDYGGRTVDLWRVLGDTKAGGQARVVPCKPDQ